ncbi:hypothetical protein ACFY1P_16025 [Streptomyces sp. NPDC001407]|uniref:phage tail termination protein n=1 Tax=Streptomyces sp. NPDC001407 TaxID=3364573 RepID=UPI0036A6D48A
MMWPDAEAALVAWLAPHLGVRVCTDTPADLADAVPLVRLHRIGGRDDGFRLDHALVDVDAFAATRADAVALATRTRAVLVGSLPGSVVRTPAAVFTAASTVSAPSWRPWENPGVIRIGATYAVRLHAA